MKQDQDKVRKILEENEDSKEVFFSVLYDFAQLIKNTLLPVGFPSDAPIFSTVLDPYAEIINTAFKDHIQPQWLTKKPDEFDPAAAGLRVSILKCFLFLSVEKLSLQPIFESFFSIFDNKSRFEKNYFLEFLGTKNVIWESRNLIVKFVHIYGRKHEDDYDDDYERRRRQMNIDSYIEKLLGIFQDFVRKHETEFDKTMGDELKEFVKKLPYVYRKDLELPPEIMGTYKITTFVPQNREWPDEGESTLKVEPTSHLWSY